MIKQGALILAAGRPILLASRSMNAMKAERIVVAWKDTREARRAVRDAMPFLVGAQDVLVTTIEENDAFSGNESVADVARYLVRRGVQARSQAVSVGHADPAPALSEIACDVGAGLIVPGGYGHSRLRELVFGGDAIPPSGDFTQSADLQLMPLRREWTFCMRQHLGYANRLDRELATLAV